ncbi:MAG TPA: hypothetical protein VMK42_03070 [Anaeromyxobacteraceae bacterium]|nr:hypothetical protein [Anaeromyxobacteraceae bacterium]
MKKVMLALAVALAGCGDLNAGECGDYCVCWLAGAIRCVDGLNQVCACDPAAPGEPCLGSPYWHTCTGKPAPPGGLPPGQVPGPCPPCPPPGPPSVPSLDASLADGAAAAESGLLPASLLSRATPVR